MNSTAEDLFASYFFGGRIPALPTVRRPQDAYHWLEDSDDEKDFPKSKHPTISRGVAPYSGQGTRPVTSIDPKNVKRKRPIHTTSCEATDRDPKKMKVEIKRDQAAAQNHQTRPSARQETFDLSISPPPQMRKTAAGQQQQQSSHAQQTVFPSPQSQIRHLNQHGATTTQLQANNLVSTMEARQENTTTTATPNPQTYLRPLEQTSRSTQRPDNNRTPRITTPNTSGPFVIDDSSDDEEATYHTHIAQDSQLEMAMVKRRATALDGAVRPQMDAKHRERQLAESRKRRQEAEERKRETPSSLGVKKDLADLAEGSERGFDGMDGNVSLQNSDDRDPKPLLEYFEDSVRKAQQYQKARTPAQGSIVDLTRDDDIRRTLAAALGDRYAQAPQAVVSYAHKVNDEYQRVKDIQEAKRKRDADQKQKQEAEARKVSEARRRSEAEQYQRTGAKMSAEADPQRKKRDGVSHVERQQMEQLQEAQREKQADLQARVAAIDEKEKKEGEAGRSTEKRYPEVDEQQLARARMQEEYDQIRNREAEDAQRSRAVAEAQRKLETLRKAEAEKEAVAKKEEERKRQLEQKQWDERKKAQDAQREAYRKRQAEVEKERSGVCERQAALAKLSAVRPPQVAKKEAAPIVTGEADISDVVAKHVPYQGSRFKDEGGEGIAADVARKHVKEIKERHGPDGLLAAKTNAAPTLQGEAESQMSERDRRIMKMAERNMRQYEANERERNFAEAEEDGELVLKSDDLTAPSKGLRHEFKRDEPEKRGKGRRDSRAPTPTSPPDSKGPVSLRSATEQGLLTHTTRAKPNSNRHDTAESPKRKSHGRQLGEILPEDIQLVRWRDGGMLPSDISFTWQKTFGAVRAQKTLMNRYRQVKDTLQTARVYGDGRLLDRMMGGDAEARVEVNRAVHGVWPLPSERPPALVAGAVSGDGEELSSHQALAQRRPRSANGHFLPMGERDGERKAAGPATPKKPDPARSLQISFGSSTTEGTLDHEDDPTNRPQTAGKTMTEEAFHYYLQECAEVYAEQEEEAESTTVPEPSPITEEDAYHFFYQVQRRELKQQDLDDGCEIEEEEWKVCGKPFASLAKANAKAGTDVFLIPQKWKEFANSDIEYDWKSRNLDNGRKIFTVDWEGVGKVQTCVVRDIHYLDDGILPKSKDGWAPKTIYFIRERTTTKTGGNTSPSSDDEDIDALFTEATPLSTTDTTLNVDNAVYTTLEEANAVAIKHFISRTFSPKSAHYVKRKMEIRDAEKVIERELEEDGAGDEDMLFWKEIEDQEGRRKVVVWVEEGRLRGPRNL